MAGRGEERRERGRNVNFQLDTSTLLFITDGFLSLDGIRLVFFTIKVLLTLLKNTHLTAGLDWDITVPNRKTCSISVVCFY